MADQPADNTARAGASTDTSTKGVQQDPPEFKAIESQEDLDKIIAARLGREQKKYSDYDELKAKATKLDEAERASLSELEKLQKDLGERDAKIATLTKSTLSAEVAAAKGVPADLLRGSTKEELEASADKLLEFRGEKPQPMPSSSALGRANPSSKGTSGMTTREQFAAQLDGIL